MGSRIPIRSVGVAVAAAGGAALVGLVAAATSMSRADALELVALAAGTAAVAGIAGACVLHALRRASLTTQVVGLALVAVGSLAVGVWVAAVFMFISDRDLAELAVILTAAGTMSVAAAIVLGRRVGTASTSLVAATRRLAEAEPVGGERAVVDAGPAELDRLARELERTSARLDSSRQREHALEQSRRELVAWVSHDLRTPLAGIRAMAEALEDGVIADPDAVGRYHTTLRVQSERLSALVDDLFELSRTQAGVLRLHLEQISLSDLVSDVIAGVAPVAEAKGVRLEGRLDGPQPQVNVSTTELLRALRNIVENAIRHTPSDGTVFVEAGRAKNRAYVSVVDHGGGIPEADLGRVFDVAFRGDPARTPGEGGGLGLAIARGLVEAHDGDISVRNENGGCRFTVRLPI